MEGQLKACIFLLPTVLNARKLKMQTYISSKPIWKRKSFFYLALAALSVSWTGFSFSSSFNFLSFIIVSLTTLSLVAFIYGFDDFMDEFNLNDRILKTTQLPLLALIAGLSILSVAIFLKPASFFAALFILLIGIFYSYRFNNLLFHKQLKSFFLFKNILIGYGWGLLIFLGSSYVEYGPTGLSMLFFSIQVIIGSIIRDFDDLKEDQINGIRTLPVVLGQARTLFTLHLFNAISLLILALGFFAAPQFKTLWLLWSLVPAYRFVLIEVIRKQKEPTAVYFQQLNMATCGLIFLLRLVHIWIF